ARVARLGGRRNRGVLVFPAMKVRDFALRFAFGAGIALASGVVGAVAGERIGGVLLGFPAILPASLTLIERKDGRHEAAVDATGAILGSVALILFAAARRKEGAKWRP